jgi:BirA family biotin operon repressor/biotin-[acetyl-CoA-carboxylase] ligase
MSLSIELKKDETAVSITTMAAIAAALAIEEQSGRKPLIKWVNDLYIDGKKICGILAERTGRGAVVGIGVNIGGAEFPSSLKDSAASIERPEVDRNVLAASIASGLLKLFENPYDRTYMREYRERSMVLGKPVEYLRAGIKKHGVAHGIDDDGGLIVETDGGQEILNSGK